MIDTSKHMRALRSSKTTKGEIVAIARMLCANIDHYQSEEIQNKINGFDNLRAVSENRLEEIKDLREEKSAAHKSVGTSAKIIKEQQAVIDGMDAAIVAQATFISMKNLVGSKTWEDATKGI